MKRRIETLPKPSVGAALALVALSVALTGTATAAGLITGRQIKDGTIQAVDLSKGLKTSIAARSDGNSIEGAWRFTVTRTEAGAPPPFTAYVTFAAGGAASEVNQNNQSTALGSWTKLGGHQYRYTVTRFRFSPAGAAVGTLTPLEADTLSQDGNTIDGTSTVTVSDLSGNVITTGTATTHGVRIQP